MILDPVMHDSCINYPNMLALSRNTYIDNYVDSTHKYTHINTY